MSKTYEVDLETLAGGALPERFDHELRKVIANMRDPNTKPDAKRSIIIKVGFEPGEDRSFANVTLDVVAKLAPLKTVKTSVHVGEKGGEEILIGYDPRQPSLFPDDNDPDVKPPRPTADQVAAHSDSDTEE